MPTKINYLLGIFLSLIILISSEPSFALNNPQLLPDVSSPVLDLAKTLSPQQKESLEKDLNKFEVENGWKIKYLSQYESNPGLAIKDYWDLDGTSLLVVADPRGGNLLNFNVGDAYFHSFQDYFGLNYKQDLGINITFEITEKMEQLLMLLIP